jgi:hypothetical protein
MSIHFHRLTNQKSTSPARAGSGSAILLPFGNRGHQFAKIRPTPFKQWSSAKAAAWPVPAATGGSATDRSRPSALIIDFAQARRSARPPRIREEASNERQLRGNPNHITCSAAKRSGRSRVRLVVVKAQIVKLRGGRPVRTARRALERFSAAGTLRIAFKFSRLHSSHPLVERQNAKPFSYLACPGA